MHVMCGEEKRSNNALSTSKNFLSLFNSAAYISSKVLVAAVKEVGVVLCSSGGSGSDCIPCCVVSHL